MNVSTRQFVFPGPYSSLVEIQEANRKHNGGQWFSPETLAFFKSVVYPFVVGGRLFVTSERESDEHPRLYTVRVATDEGKIGTVSEFQEFENFAEALTAAEALVELHAGPLLGDGVQYSVGSDRYPGTIIGLKRYLSGPLTGSVREITVQEDHATVVSGSEQDGSARYEFKGDANGRTWTFTYRPVRGRFIQQGQDNGGLSLSGRGKYYDPHL